MKKALIVLVILAVLGGIGALIPVGGDDGQPAGPTEATPALDLSGYSAEPTGSELDLLFIHHSVGGTLLADQGEVSGEHAPQCVWESHPNGGGLRARLEQADYDVHEASYGSRIGEDTDMFHWLPKFRNQMDEVLSVDIQDEQLEGDERNDIVMFKSCFPNSSFEGEGQAPGDPTGPELTIWNARATMNALLEVFGQHPDVLFVYVTAPPQAPPTAEPAWKWLARKILGRSQDPAEQRRAAALARQFNNWVRSPTGWLANYPHDNVVVFDYYNILTDDGASNSLAYPTGGGTDSHPSAEGNQRAAEAVVPFLNRAVRRAGLVQPAASQPSAETDDSEATTDAGVTADGGVAADGG